MDFRNLPFFKMVSAPFNISKNKNNFSMWSLAKNGSFGFAKGRLVYRAKPNVPFVQLAKIVFKKCEVGKNKNAEALAFGSAV